MKLTNTIAIAAIAVAAIATICVKVLPLKKTNREVIIPKDVESVVETKLNEVTITQKKIDKKTNQVEVTQVKKYKAPEAKVTQINKEDGTVTVEVQSHGFCHTPEIATHFSKEGVSFGTGIKWYYWNRLSTSVGICTHPVQFIDVKHLHSDLYVSLDWAIHNNTRAGIYYSPLHKAVGLRLSISF